ncbi:multicopper oxidase domain-containing protein [Methylobacterium segetis]|uniref:multicopper oxidase domain-containing protein n=1 Tax=Methylobacterium segetis TaxID=2488750 RepID=UPI00104A4CBB|nr:multicopper oxidase domain-containing protein [Methylobacterium segetis]
MHDAPRFELESRSPLETDDVQASLAISPSQTPAQLARRDVLRLGAASLAAATMGVSPGPTSSQTACAPCTSSTTAATFKLAIADVATTMIDGTVLNMLGFGLLGGSVAPRVPGPVLRVKEGAAVQITICNTRREAHTFEVTEVPGSKIELGPGCSGTVSFIAPAAGTYLYHDGLGGSPLYRILGLHGVLIVEPVAGTTAAGSPTPYSLNRLDDAQRTAISRLFDAFGTTPRFPGGKWQPAPSNAEFSIQEKIWLLCDVDPKFSALIEPGRAIRSSPTLTKDVIGNFVSRYFTINNRSGFDAAEGEDIVARNFIGEPTLLRVANAGLATHSNHIHGNDVFQLTEPELDPLSPNFGAVTVSRNIFSLDTWSMFPLLRRDVLLPFEVPTDIPSRIPVANPNPAARQFTRMVAGQTQEPLPLRYVMHCHTEMSQTAAGGNYPQGMVTHFEILGGVDGRPKSKLAAR